MKKNTFHVGDIVTFGKIDEKEIEWKIVTIDGEDALIASYYGVSLHAFHCEPSPVAWEACSLRHWLNNDFLQSAFSNKDQEKIHSVMLADEKTELSFTDDQAADKVFILSESETERYFRKQSDRVLLYNDRLSGTWSFSNGLMTTCRWWMRGKTQEINGRYCAPVCDHDGSFGGYQIASSQRMAVRPAMWVDLSALRPTELPDIDHLSIRLKKGELGTLTFFSGGLEDQRNVLARFVDYETQEEYVMFYEPYYLDPRVAKISIDSYVGNAIRDKAKVLCSLLRRNTYDDAADQLQRKMDENRVRSWMHQLAWSSSSGEYDEKEEGSIINFGKTSPEKGKKRKAIPWIVLKRSGSKALLITEKGLKSSTFMENDSEAWEWEHSEIRRWLNTEFYKKCFSNEEKKKIQKCMTDCGDILGRANESGAVYDHVFLLNDAEANLFFKSDAARKITGTPDDVSILRFERDEDAGDWWWLRSPGDTFEYACCVNPDGGIDRHGAWVHSTVCAIRPVILIDLSWNDKRIEMDNPEQNLIQAAEDDEQIPF